MDILVVLDPIIQLFPISTFFSIIVLCPILQFEPIDTLFSIDEEAIKTLALDLDNVKKQIGGREIRRIVVVPNRIVNVVI